MNIFHFVQAHPYYSVLISFPTATLMAMLGRLGWKGFDVFCAWVLPREDMSDDTTIEVVLKFLQTHGKQVGIRTSTWDASRLWIRSKNEYRMAFQRVGQYSDGFYLYRGAPIWMNRAQETKTEKTRTHFRFIRGTVNWRKLIEESALFWDANRNRGTRAKSFKVVRFAGSMTGNKEDGTAPPAGGTKKEEVTLSSDGCWLDECANDIVGYTREDFVDEDYKDPDPFETLALSAAMKHCIRDAKFWFSKKRWYTSKQIPWRRGYLLYGMPGCGKTSLVRSLAQYLDIPIHIFDLSSMSNYDLTSCWRASRDAGMRLVLFEDFDNVFHQRANMVPGSKLTFDHLLNLLDGIERESGLLLIVTANHPEHIDEALGKILPDGRSTRPGRIDKGFGLPALNEDGRSKIAVRIIDDPDVAKRLVIEGEGDSGAQFTERCVQYALNELWKAEPTIKDDDPIVRPKDIEHITVNTKPSSDSGPSNNPFGE